MSTDIHSLVGAYALDAVEEFERRQFERHLAECESCRVEAEELRATAARLADSTWSVPPPRLRENVLTAITQTRQLPPATARAPREFRWRRLIAAAAVVVAVAGAGVTGYSLQNSGVRREQAAQARIEAVLAAPDLVTRTTPVSGGGRVTVASSRLRNAGLIVLAADAAPPNGRVYQLWTIRDGAPYSAGVLKPGQSTKLQFVEGIPGASDVGVTVEPKNGSKAPTSPIIADVKLA